MIHDGAGAIYVEKTLMQKYGDAFLSEGRRRRGKGVVVVGIGFLGEKEFLSSSSV